MGQAVPTRGPDERGLPCCAATAATAWQTVPPWRHNMADGVTQSLKWDL